MCSFGLILAVGDNRVERNTITLKSNKNGPAAHHVAPWGGTRNSCHSCHFCHGPKLPGGYPEFLSFLSFLPWPQAPWEVPGILVIPVILIMAQVPLRELGP
jgi:hypothetical protein